MRPQRVLRNGLSAERAGAGLLQPLGNGGLREEVATWRLHWGAQHVQRQRAGDLRQRHGTGGPHVLLFSQQRGAQRGRRGGRGVTGRVGRGRGGRRGGGLTAGPGGAWRRASLHVVLGHVPDRPRVQLHVDPPIASRPKQGHHHALCEAHFIRALSLEIPTCSNVARHLQILNRPLFFFWKPSKQTGLLLSFG